MIVLGVNDSSHDASVTLVDDGSVIFAGHSERYNKEKNTFSLSSKLISEALSYAQPDQIAYFENRTKKRLRRFIHGGINGAYEHLYSKKFSSLSSLPEIQFSHHESHAYAGFLTSPFETAAIVVSDAIGEFETTSIWIGSDSGVRKVYSLKYPTSLGLFYSAFTRLVNLVPARDEYILMGMAAYGSSERFYPLVNSLFPSLDDQKINFHLGVEHLFESQETFEWKASIAAAVQRVFTERTFELHQLAQSLTGKKDVVYMGGCALNCSTNTQLLNLWDEMWIMPNPGDAGSSMGAALATTRSRCENFSPYLGHEIKGDYPVEASLKELLSKGVTGIASGRAEFGPRALGNRSLLADPRPQDTKSFVNQIKNREPFRPFAPVILEEYSTEWFDMDRPSPYMQFTFKCKKPLLVPSVVHEDGTSRVQTVNQTQHPGLYSLLKAWNDQTGVPLLLNTSLNVKNQPLVNDEEDVKSWLSENPDFSIHTAERTR